MIRKIFPFLSWFDDFNLATLRADFIAGLTIALVLIPQSMAYAQLAGLPPYYGLYASFLPPMVASLFGSSRLLATGPVAVVSMMTAASLEPLATAGSQQYIAYALLLALVVGLFQFALGAFRLGFVVNFLSHPVVNGFTNAAAIIIATSQLSKLFGVYVDKAPHHYETLIRVIRAAFHYTHIPTLLLAVLAIGIMYGLRKINPRIPNVLIAVIITTIISWAIGFQKNQATSIDNLMDAAISEQIRKFNQTLEEIDNLGAERSKLNAELTKVQKEQGKKSIPALELRHRIAVINLKIKELKDIEEAQRTKLRLIKFGMIEDAGGNPRFYQKDNIPDGSVAKGGIWRLKIGNKKLNETELLFIGGGAVVGVIPRGIPKLKLPMLDLSLILQLLSTAVIISLLGFMEAISIAKAIAAKTHQRLDPNQELIGQGLANIIGSLGQSYPVSGSFSRSAVNLQAGGITGLSNVFTSCIVVITLLFFTPLLYHLPQSVLASIIMMAVINLVNIPSFIHTWRAQRADGAISIITFVCTLGFAPHLDKGIMIGVVLSLWIYLYKHMRPKVSLLSKTEEGTYKDQDEYGLKQCRRIAAIRFAGSLFFVNTSYLEDKVLEVVASMPNLKHILIVGNGINLIDASGEELLSLLVDRLRDAGYEVSFSGLNPSVIKAMKRTHLYEKIGEHNFFPNVATAISVIHAEAHRDSREDVCPLLTVVKRDESEE